MIKRVTIDKNDILIIKVHVGDSPNHIIKKRFKKISDKIKSMDFFKDTKILLTTEKVEFHFLNKEEK